MQVFVDFVTMPNITDLEGQTLELTENGSEWDGSHDYEVNVSETLPCSAVFTENTDDLSLSTLSVTMGSETKSGTPTSVTRDVDAGTYELAFQFQYTRPGAIGDDPPQDLRVFRVRGTGLPIPPRWLTMRKMRSYPGCTLDFYVNDPVPETLVTTLTADIVDAKVDLRGGNLARGVYNVKVTSSSGQIVTWAVIDCTADGDQIVELPWQDELAN